MPAPIQAAAARLAAIVESSDDAIISKDINGTIESWNRAAERIFGYTAAEAIGQHISLIIPPDRRHEEDTIIGKIRAGQRVEHFETVRRHKDGTPISLSITVSPIRDEHGTIVGASKIARDITERAKADETAYRLAAIVDSSDDAIVSKDLNGIVSSWNKGAARIFGYSAEEAIGQHITLIIPSELRHEEDQILGKVRRGERVDHFETTRRRKDGSPVYVSITVSPMRNAAGQITGASKIARDISEAKRQAETRELLVHEIRHRVKNVLSTIDAVATQTLKQVPPAITEQFSARLRALARGHDLLTEQDWRGTDLASLIFQSHAIFGTMPRDRFSAQGPKVTLNANNSLLFALVFHELGTNALKYGAWSNDSGAVTITWGKNADGELELAWTETGGPRVSEPERQGFGSTLIKRALNQSGSKGALEFPSSGVVCRLQLSRVALSA